MKNKTIFQIAGVVLNNHMLKMKNGKLEMQPFNHSLPISGLEHDLEAIIREKHHYFNNEYLDNGIVSLMNGEVPYVITENSDEQDKDGYFIYFMTAEKKLAGRHFNLINNNAIMNLAVFIYLNADDFVSHTMRTETRYGFLASAHELLAKGKQNDANIAV